MLLLELVQAQNDPTVGEEEQQKEKKEQQLNSRQASHFSISLAL